MNGRGLTVFHLYPVEMNLYGDTGNVLTLSRRLEWRGFGVRVVPIEPGDRVDFADADLLFMGGGQDRGQEAIAEDLLERGDAVRAAVREDLPTLLICGGYQLFGEYFDTVDGVRLPGLGVIPAYTVGARERLIGNVVVDATDAANEEAARTGRPRPVPGESLLVGFENHSGRTVLRERARRLGRIVRGRGNDGSGGDEGAVWRNVFGTYLHGSLLPKNPWFADLLLLRALQRRFGGPDELQPLDDAAEEAARRRAIERASRGLVRRMLEA